MVDAALWGLVAAVAVMGLTWVASVARRDASLVDRVWGLGFVVLAWVWWLLGDRDPVAAVPAVLVTVWGLRLSAHLTWRNWGGGEDRRYRRMRERHGERFWLVSLVTVFALQTVIMWVVALPLLATGLGLSVEALGGAWAAVAVAGGLVWLVGVLMEAVADRQLARFTADPANAGRVMDRGLWRWSRHPNYFGEICVWWGVWLLAVPAGGWWTVVGPALITFLLVRVSGVRLLEADIAERRPEYRDYVRRTNALVPGPSHRARAGR